MEGLDRGISLGGLREHEGGLTAEEGARRVALYGPNEILVPLDSLGVILVKEILSPFYVFQVGTPIFPPSPCSLLPAPCSCVPIKLRISGAGSGSGAS